jgi:hypothetical protein
MPRILVRRGAQVFIRNCSCSCTLDCREKRLLRQRLYAPLHDSVLMIGDASLLVCAYTYSCSNAIPSRRSNVPRGSRLPRTVERESIASRLVQRPATTSDGIGVPHCEQRISDCRRLPAAEAVSIVCASANATSSRQRRAAICTPTGSPRLSCRSSRCVRSPRPHGRGVRNRAGVRAGYERGARGAAEGESSRVRCAGLTSTWASRLLWTHVTSM